MTEVLHEAFENIYSKTNHKKGKAISNLNKYEAKQNNRNYFMCLHFT